MSQPRNSQRYDGTESVTFSVRATDGVYGQPATGIPISFAKVGQGVSVKHRTITDADGRATFVFTDLPVDIVRIELDVDVYFSTLGVKPAYPDISIACRTSEGHGRHVDLTLTPSAYVVSAESWNPNLLNER
jgi:5-hydroxyisourate hydrolase-like protein (transthyretin family)